MGKLAEQSTIDKVEFMVIDDAYITIKELVYKDIVIPKGYMFDGLTIWIPFTMFFGTQDIRRGIKASCFHDWLCDNRQNYTMTEATKILIELWKGLSPFQAFLVKISVNIYQFFRSGWKKRK